MIEGNIADICIKMINHNPELNTDGYGFYMSPEKFRLFCKQEKTTLNMIQGFVIKTDPMCGVNIYFSKTQIK